MAKIKMFSMRGDDVLLNYDPATANIAEINEELHRIEKATGGAAYNLDSGDRVHEITPDLNEVNIIRQQAGG